MTSTVQSGFINEGCHVCGHFTAFLLLKVLPSYLHHLTSPCTFKHCSTLMEYQLLRQTYRVIFSCTNDSGRRLDQLGLIKIRAGPLCHGSMIAENGDSEGIFSYNEWALQPPDTRPGTRGNVCLYFAGRLHIVHCEILCNYEEYSYLLA